MWKSEPPARCEFEAVATECRAHARNRSLFGPLAAEEQKRAGTERNQRNTERNVGCEIARLHTIDVGRRALGLTRLEIAFDGFSVEREIPERTERSHAHSESGERCDERRIEASRLVSLAQLERQRLGETHLDALVLPARRNVYRELAARITYGETHVAATGVDAKGTAVETGLHEPAVDLDVRLDERLRVATNRREDERRDLVLDVGNEVRAFLLNHVGTSVESAARETFAGRDQLFGLDQDLAVDVRADARVGNVARERRASACQHGQHGDEAKAPR
jgi:hypothetical protein